MIFLAPIAAAGYFYWDKKRKERLAQENGEGDELAEESVKDKPSDESTGDDNSQEETSWDLIGESGETKECLTVATEETPSIVSATSESLSSSLHTTPDVSPRESAAEAGPMGKFKGKFHKFCNNLEKEYAKAEARKAQEDVWRRGKLEALDEPQGAIPKIASPNASVPKITLQ
jgi:hypothetical protein